MPVLRPRDNKNKNEVSVRVLRSKRFSKNSYAVYTFSLLKTGTKNIQITIMASGSPK